MKPTEEELKRELEEIEELKTQPQSKMSQVLGRIPVLKPEKEKEKSA